MKAIFPIHFPNIDNNVDTEVIFQDVDDPTKKVKRTGFCNRCGKCCISDEKIFATHDGNGVPIDTPLVQVVPGMCAYFRWTPEGLGECTGRDTNYYKNGCRHWPSEPEHMLYPECGYKFEWITD